MARPSLLPLLLLLLCLALCVAHLPVTASPLTRLSSRLAASTPLPRSSLKATSPSSPAPPTPSHSHTSPPITSSSDQSTPSPTPSSSPPHLGVIAASASNYSFCNACLSIASHIRPFVEDQRTLSVIEDAAVLYCVATKAEGQCSGALECLSVCKGVIGEWGPIVVDIYTNSSLSAQAVCYDLGQCPAPVPPSGIPGVPVPSNVSDMTGQKRWPFWDQTKGTGTILHISDFHFDVLYAAGMRTDCGTDLCCRAEDGPGTNSSNTAGAFGDYKCDTPAALASSLLEYLNSSLTPRPDFILYTGDDPAHDIWSQSRASNLAAMRWVNSQLLRYFPDVPIFSAVGNHEACPVNEFGGPGVDTWLYSQLVQTWSYYLPADAQQTLNYGAYYVALVRPGLYVISINTNIYADADYYLNKQAPFDLSNQLNWFNDTMYQVQQLGGRVVIIGHSSPIDWLPEFSSAFNAYLDQYQASILNLFFGHTHHNQVQLYHPPTTSSPHTVGYIGGSVTPYTNTNPGFSVYSYDRSLSLPYLVTDAQLHWLDLPAANAKGQADWSQVRLTASSAYQLKDLSPASWFNLAETIRTGGAADIYERLQTAWNKGVYSRGQGSKGERLSFACEIENDQDEAANQCRRALGLDTTAAVRASHQHSAARGLAPLPSCLDSQQRVLAMAKDDAVPTASAASMLRTVRSALHMQRDLNEQGKRSE